MTKKNQKIWIEDIIQKIETDTKLNNKKTSHYEYKIEEILSLTGRIGGKIRPKYIIDDSNIMTIKTLIKYFFRDPNFEKDNKNFSLNKGLLLMGLNGIGKTLLFEIFQNLLRIFKMENQFRVVYATEIVEEYLEGGCEKIKKFGRCSFKNDEYGEKKQSIHYDIEDIGAENSNIMRYGNSLNLIADIILTRYNYFHQGMLTHFTTNLNPKELEETYGNRVFSRLLEMVNFIEVQGPDWRRKLNR